MKRFISCLAALLCVGGCNEAVEYGSQWTLAESSILMSDLVPEMETAWQPCALFSSGGDVTFADRGTREIRRLNAGRNTTSLVADLSTYEALSLPEGQSAEAAWGKSLLNLGGGILVVAGEGRRLLLVDEQSGRAAVFPPAEALDLPEHGVSIASVNFSSLSGAGLSDDRRRLYLAFGQQVFDVDVDVTGGLDGTVSALALQKLRHVAGALHSAPSQKFNRAVEEPLNLPAWTTFAERGGTLYFFEPPRLRAVRDGLILTLGGDGNEIHGNVLSTTRFYDMADSPRILFCGDSLCSPGYKESYLLKIRVEQEDFVSGEAEGTVSFVEIGKAEDMAEDDTVEGLLHTVRTDGGGVWKVSADDPGAELVFGLADEAARFDAAREQNERVNPSTVLRPQSVLVFDEFLLTNAPTISRMTLSRLGHFDKVLPFWLNLNDEPVMTVASYDRMLWMVQGRDLLMLELDADEQLVTSVVPGFFKVPQYGGIPMESTKIRLPEPPLLLPLSRGLAFYLRRYGWFAESAGGQTQFITQPGRITGLPEEAQTESLASFDIGAMSWRATFGNMLVGAQIMDEETKLYVANASLDVANLFGVTVKGNRVARLSGTADRQALADGSPVSHTAIPSVDAVGLGDGGVIWFVRNGTFWSVERTGLIRRHAEIESCGVPVAAPDWLAVSTLSGGTTVYARINGRISACAAGTDHWQDTGLATVSLCPNIGALVGMRDDGRYCIMPSGAVEEAQMYCNDSDLALSEVVCDENDLFAVGVQPDGEHVVARASLRRPHNLEVMLGGGFGVVDRGSVSKVRTGGDVAAVMTDRDGGLYVWTKDSCTVWRMDGTADLTEETEIVSVISSPMLCRADAVAVSSTGAIVAADGSMLWMAHPGTPFFEYSTLDHRIWGVQFVDDVLTALTREGLHVCYGGRCDLRVGSPVVVDGESVNFGVPSSASPQFVPYPGEHAVIMPVFHENMILKLAL